MFTKLKKSQGESEKGFTIIEVMIVLAIAGLILLIVFLAIPALQRNSRNTQRKNDAAGIAGSINEFISNNNGTTPTAAQAAGGGAAIANARLGYYTNDATHIFSANTGTPATTVGTGTATLTNVTVDSVSVWIGYTCDNNVVSGGNTRSVAVQYAVETGNNPRIQCTQS